MPILSREARVAAGHGHVKIAVVVEIRHGDGMNDIVATVDRPGTIKDSLLWFHIVGQ